MIKTDLTDHYLIFRFNDTVTCSNKTNQKVFRRDFKILMLRTFVMLYSLHNALVTFFHRNQDINDSNFNHLFCDFIEVVKSKIDNRAPLKNLSRKQRKLKRIP